MPAVAAAPVPAPAGRGGRVCPRPPPPGGRGTRLRTSGQSIFLRIWIMAQKIFRDLDTIKEYRPSAVDVHIQ